jgi:hypothetical protein
MTAVGYATIEEAWGSIDPKPSKQQMPQGSQGPQVPQGGPQKKKMSRQFPIIPKDPICELADMYSTKLSDDYTDTDLVRQSQEYQKSGYQRNMTRGEALTSDPLFEKQFDMQLPKLYDDIDDIDSGYNNAISAAIERVKSSDKEIVESPQNPQNITKPLKYDSDDDYIEESNAKKSTNYQVTSVNYIDLSLYIISGIILIFLLDQFVRIGCKLRSK